MTVKELIKKYEKLMTEIINPDGFTEWEDLGFDGPPTDDCNNVNEWLELYGEFDEGEQTELSVYEQIIKDLKEIQ